MNFDDRNHKEWNECDQRLIEDLRYLYSSQFDISRRVASLRERLLNTVSNQGKQQVREDLLEYINSIGISLNITSKSTISRGVKRRKPMYSCINNLHSDKKEKSQDSGH